MRSLLGLICLTLLLVSAPVSSDEPALGSAQNEPTRFVAITIDDLPIQRAGTLSEMQDITNALLQQIKQHQLPVIGFVNENQLFAAGQAEVAARTALLEQWLDAGLELGNHTYSHPNINQIPLDDYKADVIKGEKVTRELLADRGLDLRYFRHPFLRTGNNPENQSELERFLRKAGYTVAPVTVDNSEWIYAFAYERLLRNGETEAAHAVGEDYLRYMEYVFAFYEQLSTEVIGREIKQTLLIHANRLNGDYLGKLATMLQRRGYQFISLAEALKDEAYRQTTPQVDARGISWLQRWAIGKGMPPGDEPAAADFVAAQAQ